MILVVELQSDGNPFPPTVAPQKYHRALQKSGIASSQVVLATPPRVTIRRDAIKSRRLRCRRKRTLAGANDKSVRAITGHPIGVSADCHRLTSLILRCAVHWITF